MYRRAFSLIELIAVLIIIGVLVGLAVPRYIQSTKKARQVAFETNFEGIIKALEKYKTQGKFQNFNYPVSLENTEFKMLFTKEPINPYTNKSMLSNNPADSGIQYQIADNEYRICITQQDVDDVNNNGVIAEALPLSTQNACTGNVKTSSINITFTRNSVAFTDDGAHVEANVPRYKTSKFGQGIFLEEGTTNYFPVDDATGKNLNSFPSNWGKYSINSVETTFGLGDSYSIKSYQVEQSFNYGFYYFAPSTWTITENSIYTFSYYIYNTTTTSHRFLITIVFIDSAGNWFPEVRSAFIVDPGKWTRLSVTATAPAGAVKVLLTGYEDGYYTTSNVGDVYYFDNFQFEQKRYATSWTVGTRTYDKLIIPTSSIISPQEGTIELIWIPKQPISAIDGQGTSPKIFEIGNYYYNNSLVLWAFYAGVAKEPHLRIYVKGSSSSGWSIAKTVIGSGKGWYKVGEPIYLAVKWTNGNAFWVSVNGVTYGPYTISDSLTGWAGNKMWLPYSAASHPNAIYDEIRISNRARTDAEIQAAYRNNQSLPVDAWTTLKLDFNGDLSTQSGVIP